MFFVVNETHGLINVSIDTGARDIYIYMNIYMVEGSCGAVALLVGFCDHLRVTCLEYCFQKEKLSEYGFANLSKK